MFLPVLTNLFNRPMAQSIIVRMLKSSPDLKVWDACYGTHDDGEKVWDWTSPETYHSEDGYYAMIGVEPGCWAFLPSFLNKVFRIDGVWYTVIYQEHSAEYYDGGYFLRRLPSLEDSEDLAERFV